MEKIPLLCKVSIDKKFKGVQRDSLNWNESSDVRHKQ